MKINLTNCQFSVIVSFNFLIFFPISDFFFSFLSFLPCHFSHLFNLLQSQVDFHCFWQVVFGLQFWVSIFFDWWFQTSHSFFYLPNVLCFRFLVLSF